MTNTPDTITATTIDATDAGSPDKLTPDQEKQAQKVANWLYYAGYFLLIGLVGWALYSLFEKDRMKMQGASPVAVAQIEKDVKATPWNNCPSSVNAWSGAGKPLTYIQIRLDANSPITYADLDRLSESIADCNDERVKTEKNAALAQAQKAMLGSLSPVSKP